jgi:hypothetical protein
MTIRPARRSPDTDTHPLTHDDGLHRARRRGLMHALELLIGDGRVVPQRLLPMQLEHV